MRRKNNNIILKWSPNFAYAIGLIATDGCVGRDGSYVDFTSKDREQVENLKKCLEIDNNIGKKYSGAGNLSYRVQFRNSEFSRFLNNIGIFPCKSKMLKEILVPDMYYFDFLRGVFDGDGSSNSYWDLRWKSSFMFYVNFASASKVFIDWIRMKNNMLCEIFGHTTKNKNDSCFQLKYAKRDSLVLLKKMYYSSTVICLSRKRLKNEKILGIVGESLFE